jgi:uncharacterized membrane protein YbaN (DUF454 family)
MGNVKLVPWTSRFYLSAGFVLVGLGVLGIPLPLLPTTPFLLLAAFCFARSSSRWHRWLITHRVLGPYIAAFRERRGLTAEQKWRIAGTVTLTLLITAWLAPVWIGRALAGFIWVSSLAFLYLSPTAKKLTASEESE